MAITAPAPLTDEELAARTPEEELAIFGQDGTDSTLITFRGSVEIEHPGRHVDRFSAHARTIRFRVVHHVDHQYDAVEILIESPDRPRDTLDAYANPDKPGSSVVSFLGTLVDYVTEQERRIAKEIADVG